MAEVTTERRAGLLDGVRRAAVRVATAAGGRGGAVALLLLLVVGVFVATLGADSVLGIPLIVAVAAACALLGWFVLSRTKLGRAAYAIGGNREAARVSGIRIERPKFWIYVISGVLANGLSILGVAEFWQRVVNGLIIVAVVALDQWRRRAATRGSGGLKPSPPVDEGQD